MIKDRQAIRDILKHCQKTQKKITYYETICIISGQYFSV